MWAGSPRAMRTGVGVEWGWGWSDFLSVREGTASGPYYHFSKPLVMRSLKEVEDLSARSTEAAKNGHVPLASCFSSGLFELHSLILSCHIGPDGMADRQHLGLLGEKDERDSDVLGDCNRTPISLCEEGAGLLEAKR